jgi:glutamate synthase domain-containing protein 3
MCPRFTGRHTIDFEGSAGQSFGAFATNGLSFKIHGNCNDYLGKDSQELN